VVIAWSIPARQDLRLIHQYIAHDSKRYATRVLQDITEKVEVLLELPRLSRVVPEIGEENVREISMYSYRIMYELIEDTSSRKICNEHELQAPALLDGEVVTVITNYPLKKRATT
jgi:toxin ParE1/3/4